jgi:hypothetical protein
MYSKNIMAVPTILHRSENWISMKTARKKSVKKVDKVIEITFRIDVYVYMTTQPINK